MMLSHLGDIYLVNLIKNKHFNTIFTTNFDDLVNEACYTFSDDLRPIVSAHDSSIRSVRLTSTRPKIIKLHGDFLFDNIKNTARELESLEDNMRAKFRQYANEFGMIFVGYAGNDRSIMDTLNTLLHSSACFPHGIYWCVMKGTKFDDLSAELKNLSRFPRFHLVEIDGFDEFFAETHHSLNCVLQEQISNPYNALSCKLNKIFNEELADHPLIQEDFKRLTDHISRIDSTTRLSQKIENLKIGLSEEDQDEFEDNLDQLIETAEVVKNHDSVHIMSIPHFIIAQGAFGQDQFQIALDASMKALKTKVSSAPIALAIRSMIALKNYDNYPELFKYLTELSEINDKSFNAINGAVVDLIDAKVYDKAEYILLELRKHILQKSGAFAYYILNLSLIYKLKGDELSSDIVKDLEDELKNATDENDVWLASGLSLVLGLDDVTIKMFENYEDESLQTFYLSELPIKKLISASLNDKIDRLMEERKLIENHDDHAEHIEDACDVEKKDVKDSDIDLGVDKESFSTKIEGAIA